MKKVVLLGPVNYIGFAHTKATALKKVCKILEASKTEKREKYPLINLAKDDCRHQKYTFTMRQYLRYKAVNEDSSWRRNIRTVLC